MDAIKIYCGKCGKKLEVKAVEAGGTTECTKCGVRVPIPSSNLDRAQIRIFCTKCGSRLRAWPDEEGKQVKCRRCKKIISLPHIEDKDKKKAGDEDEDRPREKPSPKSRRDGDDDESDLMDLLLDDDEDEESGIVVKADQPAGPKKSKGRPMSFTDASEKLAQVKKSKRREGDEDEEEGEGMISFDEFLVDDEEPKAKKRRREPKERAPGPKPRLSDAELRRARRETDELPSSTADRQKKPTKPAPKGKTLVIECEECGMRLVFRNREPMPNAKCPACGEELVW